jgi:TolB-like protein/tRNA A-37 threonylcarbamoyl transferase component Bud32/tetratricopeptide (TPR) repeat protein
MNLREQLSTILGEGYELDQELTGGGMSRVFVAHERSLGRKIVIKVLSPDLAAGISNERFSREIRVAASLQQANIVPLFSAGESGGLAFYTMPYVEGHSLRQRLASGPLPIPEAINTLRDVARALAYAHERGIVHRDIKPDNVLLSGDAAVVTDFGIAKAISSARTTQDARATLTSAGAAIGTPAYMAPEQAAADPDTDHRADLYAFGCLAFELLTGNPPFHSRTPAQLMAAHVTEPAPSVGALRADTPPRLAEIIGRCLAKLPSERPQSAREILAALDDRPSAHVFFSGRKRQLLVASLVVIAAAALAFAVLLPDRSTASTSSRALAVMPFENVERDTTRQYLADGIAIDLTNALSRVPGLRVTGRSLAFSYRGRSADVRAVGRELGVDAILEGSVQRSGDRFRITAQLTRVADGVAMWSNAYERETRDLFAVQDDIARTITSELRLALGGDGAGTIAGTTNLEAYDAYLRGQYLLERRGAGVLRAVEFFNTAIARDSGFARAYAGLSEALELLPYFTLTPAHSIEARAVAAARRAIALDSTVSQAYVGLALAHDHAFRWNEAEVEFRRAIALDSSSVIAALQYGRHLLYRNRLPEAIVQFRHAANLDPLFGTALAWLAHAYSISGQHDSAIAIGRRGREVDPGLVLGKTLGAKDLLDAGRPDEARRLVSNIEGSPAWRGEAAYTLGMTGDTATARRIIAELRAMPNDTWLVHTALVYAYLGVRDTSSALSELERALAAREFTPHWETFADRMFDQVRRSARWARAVEAFGLADAGVTRR